ncbi:MAG TPA: VWA domain-containing protein, partial [Candidatus Acidoferrales bacterium]|nr:VWA domain-containing protein [Candidatus Acidoferrales bacterium]
IQGRKTVIFFTQGLRADTSSQQRVRDVVGAANRAGVSLYVIDANALTGQIDQNLMAMSAMGGVRSAAAQSGPAATTTTGANGLPQTVAQAPPGLAPMVNNQFERYETGDTNASKGPLATLAESTGGSYVASGEGMKKPLQRMIEDMTTYYEASYAPPIENYDGQFRPIAVTPIRAGLKISSRAGYFALPPDSGQTIRPFEAPLLKVLAEAQLPSDVPFRAQVLRLGDLPTGNENSLVVEVPLGQLQSENDPNSNLYAVHISIAAQIKNKAGDVVEHFGEDIPRHGALSAKDAQPQFITMQRHFTEEPGDYTLETAVFDQNSGKLGAQRVPFQIPRSGDGPSLSDISMVRRIDPVPEEADPSEPMRYGSGKVIPGLSDAVPKGTKELSFFFVVHPEPTSTEAPRLEMEVLKSGEPIAQVPLAVRKTSGPVSIPYLTSIQTATLPPGQYQVIERLTQDAKTSEQAVAFEIEGPTGVTVASAVPPASTKDDAEPLAGTGMQLPDAETPGHEGLVIKSLPADEAPAPASQQIDAMIAAARKRALDYGKTLPNFLCIEVTNRSVDASGNGRWKHRDSLAELLSYHDNQESRTTLEIDGKRSTLKRADMNSNWPLSVGEFGAMLNLVFQPSSKTEFQWKEAAALGDGSGTVQVFNYRVDGKNATIVLTEGNADAAVGFHGRVYLDPSTGGVRRVTLEADAIPHSFAVHAASMTVDYDFVGISGRDYLLPVSSSVRLEKGHHKIELNEITFRDYRRFASRTKIMMIH